MLLCEVVQLLQPRSSYSIQFVSMKLGYFACHGQDVNVKAVIDAVVSFQL